MHKELLASAIRAAGRLIAEHLEPDGRNANETIPG
jgi:hypothetical protein